MNRDIHNLLENESSESHGESGYDSVEIQKVPNVEEGNLKKFSQYYAALTASLSALCAGMVLGWTSPILDDLKNGNFRNISLTTDEVGWIGAFAPLGAVIICVPTGLLCNLIGRKKTLLSLLIPFTVGWLLILFAKNVLMLYFGRLITGMTAGATCVVVPVYISEIAHKSLRGTLSSYFQLMITVGILLAYLVGKYLTPVYFTICCLCLPFVFVLLFVCQPETPTYLIQIKLYDEARSTLSKLRGHLYNIDSEINDIEGCLKHTSQSAVSFFEVVKRKAVIKAVIISFSIFVFQQFSGVNPVITYASDIFKAASNFDANSASIIMATFQVIGTFCSSLVIDKLGRRVLLLISSSVIVISTLELAIYFSLKDANIDHDIIKKLGFLSVVFVCIFIIAFSLGLGPVPWVISSEIFPTEIQSIIVSIGGTFNWFMAFMLIKFYQSVSDFIGIYSTFYFFSLASLVGVVFIYFLLPETKGKTINEIQLELEN